MSYILLVRDGTCLAGSLVLAQEEDMPLLFCGGGIYKLSFRSQRKERKKQKT